MHGSMTRLILEGKADRPDGATFPVVADRDSREILERVDLRKLTIATPPTVDAFAKAWEGR